MKKHMETSAIEIDITATVIIHDILMSCTCARCCELEFLDSEGRLMQHPNISERKSSRRMMFGSETNFVPPKKKQKQPNSKAIIWSHLVGKLKICSSKLAPRECLNPPASPEDMPRKTPVPPSP